MAPLSQEWMDPVARDAAGELTALAHFEGPPKEFWPNYIAALAKLSGADLAALYLRDASPAESEAEDGPPAWKRIVERTSPGGQSRPGLSREIQGVIDTVAAYATEHDGCVLSLDELAPKAKLEDAADYAVTAVAPTLEAGSQQCLVLVVVRGLSESSAAELLLRLQLSRDIPGAYQRNLAARRARDDVGKIATALDLSVIVNREDRFLAAA
ncbi:MAG: hypothetical protein ACC661_07860, partial [Verrucomicrobiales bacterium]